MPMGTSDEINELTHQVQRLRVLLIGQIQLNQSSKASFTFGVSEWMADQPEFKNALRKQAIDKLTHAECHALGLEK
jgi:hypothetical protein